MEWNKTKRRWDGFVGLDPLAEWVLDAATPKDNVPATSTAPGNRQFLNVTLTSSFQNMTNADDQEAERLALGLPFLLTPVAGGVTGSGLFELFASTIAELDAQPDVRILLPLEEATALQEGGTACVLATQKFFQAVLAAKTGSAAAAFRDARKSIRLSSPVRTEAWLPDTHKPAAQSQPGLILGVIDDGFALAHRRFRRVDGSTRILHFWDQEANQQSTAILPGSEIDGGKIDAAFVAAGQSEDRFYALPDLAPFFPLRRNHVPRAFSHGTHVLDLATGAEPGAMDHCGIIAVKLPRDSVLDTSGGHLDYYLLRGVRYILDRAGSDTKVVIVISYGYYGGPHDGASAVERELDRLISIENGRLQIVLAAGNGRAERSRTRCVLDQRRAQRRTVDWQVRPDDKTPSFIEIWLPESTLTTSVLDLALETPAGLASGVLGSADIGAMLQLSENGVAVAQITVVEAPLHGWIVPGIGISMRKLFRLSLCPTTREGVLPPAAAAGFEPALAGIWRVHLRKPAGISLGALDVYIARDDSLIGFPVRGRQSTLARDGQFLNELVSLTPSQEEWLGDAGAARRSGTVSAIATGRLTIVAGGYRVKDGKPARYSAGGAVEPFPGAGTVHRTGPDALLPSDLSWVAEGIFGAGFRSGSRRGLSGTSAAAPLLAREMLGAAGNSDRAWVALRALADELSRNDGLKPSPTRGGSGRIDSVFAKTDAEHRRG